VWVSVHVALGKLLPTAQAPTSCRGRGRRKRRRRKRRRRRRRRRRLCVKRARGKVRGIVEVGGQSLGAREAGNGERLDARLGAARERHVGLAQRNEFGRVHNVVSARSARGDQGCKVKASGMGL